ncbi:MAG: biopolymer transporter ExbD [Opitutaceae bacterium]|nr:biopolymer transporter ExbD [Opitutaceae bacterium]
MFTDDDSTLSPFGAQPAGRKARIEIIPLIDVIFFLLATFVLFTLSLSKIYSIGLPLPHSDPKPESDPDNTVILQVSAADTLYWNREPITTREVDYRLRDFALNRPEGRVLIASDEHAKYGTTITLLDSIRLAGIKRVSAETLHRPTGK